MSKTLKKIETYIRQELKTLLSHCTDSQQDIFYRMYGRDKRGLQVVDKMPKTKLSWAIEQCEQSIVNNKEKLENFCLDKYKFPTAMQLSLSDSAGYEAEERWWAHGGKEHGYSGRTYMAATPKEVIEKFKLGESIYDNVQNTEN